ncbi:DUF1574 family protein [Pueribacillus sp. YX66]|uniref:DUF1574 family protein n=1 Tax=Pueribacillus sp. YX66 TaxID=3229242 RepID=UPI00358D9F01
MSAWKKIFTTVIAISLVITSGIMTLNYIVNPHGKYNSNVLPSLVWTGRSDKASLLHKLNEDPEILILGSSRSMKIDPEFIEEKTGLSSFNAAVNSANAEDYYTMLRYSLDTLERKPNTIFLGIDVEAFHNNTPIDERLLFNKALSKYLNAQDRISFIDMLTSLLSYEETTSSFVSLYYKLSAYPDRSTYYDDNGFLHYIQKSGTVTDENYDSKIEDYIERYRARYDGYTQLSDKRKDYFEKFLALAEEENIQVIAFITTLHDDIIRDLKKTRNYDDIKQKLVNYLNKMDEQNENFVYEDFDRVDKYNGVLTAFYDGAHIHEKNANRITRRLLEKAVPDEFKG